MQSFTASLTDLIKPWKSVELKNAPTIRGLALDSRYVKPGDLFFAYPGDQVDGRDYIEDALKRGAVAVIYDDGDEFALAQNLDAPCIAWTNLREDVGEIASAFYRHPSKHMTVIGVTGTNGKTSTSYFMMQLLHRLGYSCALLGTIGNGIFPDLHASPLTTMDAISLQKRLCEFQLKGVKYVALEVSSHSLAQHRVNGVEFDCAIFTNLSRDHLDYHKTMLAYQEAKFSLFTKPSLKHAVINKDDPVGQEWLAKLPKDLSVLTYSTQDQSADYAASKIVADTLGFDMRLHSPHGTQAVSCHLLGRFNVYNMLAAVAACDILQLDWPSLLAALPSLQPPAGRMQMLRDRNQPTVVIDYAHTPDALQKCLDTIREHLHGKLWCVFGCGGDRDRGKRAEMGAIAERFSDYVVLTNDNPRHEDPEAIVQEIQSGMKKPDQSQVVYDRLQAIQYALQNADAKDVILLAGKGHEPHQIVKDEHRPFNDVHVVRKLLNRNSA